MNLSCVHFTQAGGEGWKWQQNDNNNVQCRILQCFSLPVASSTCIYTFDKVLAVFASLWELFPFANLDLTSDVP